jgi:hypothetical protein
MRFKPIRWSDMPMSAKKLYVRTDRMFPNVNGRIKGWEWFSTLTEPNKTYAVSRDMRWFVADGCCLAFG